jgi:hypothetical protein
MNEIRTRPVESPAVWSGPEMALCLRPARAGGTSRIASSAAIYNEILRRRPDLVPALYQPFPFDRNGEEPPGQPIDAIAADPTVHLDMEFRAGDIQWLKNSVSLQARTEYEDFDEPERKRHLLRLGLTSRRIFADSDALLNQGIPRKQGAVSDAVASGAAQH